MEGVSLLESFEGLVVPDILDGFVEIGDFVVVIGREPLGGRVGADEGVGWVVVIHLRGRQVKCKMILIAN